jgi:hypothetical protein
MSDVDKTFSDYTTADRALEETLDPAPYLEQVQGAQREELGALIDGYLARRPRRPFDPEAFAGSHAEAVADGLHRALHGSAGIWPIVLPALRTSAQLPPEELGPKLAEALGVSNQSEKVGSYYEQMEHGRLPSSGVSDRVLTALAELVGTNPNALRQAGRPVAEPSVPESAPAASSDWDEVDDLFRGASAGPPLS